MAFFFHTKTRILLKNKEKKNWLKHQLFFLKRKEAKGHWTFLLALESLWLSSGDHWKSSWWKRKHPISAAMGNSYSNGYVISREELHLWGGERVDVSRETLFVPRLVHVFDRDLWGSALLLLSQTVSILFLGYLSLVRCKLCKNDSWKWKGPLPVWEHHFIFFFFVFRSRRCAVRTGRARSNCRPRRKRRKTERLWWKMPSRKIWVRCWKAAKAADWNRVWNRFCRCWHPPADSTLTCRTQFAPNRARLSKPSWATTSPTAGTDSDLPSKKPARFFFYIFII